MNEYQKKATVRKTKRQLWNQALQLSGKAHCSEITYKEALEQLTNLLEPSRCACGCGNYVQEPPYESGGKEYHSAYCILIESKSCYMCGGYTGDKDIQEVGHDFRCNCNWEALDQ